MSAVTDEQVHDALRAYLRQGTRSEPLAAGNVECMRAALEACERTRPTDPRVMELREAAKEVDGLYPMHWDTTGGGALIMPDRVPEFERRFQRLHSALAAFKEADNG